jgi:hypothetical protein
LALGVLAEFGDDPDRYQTAKGRKAFAGTAPVTRSSGLRTTVVARAACNERLVDACYRWAFASLTASPGARRCYDAHRARGATHHQALRALGNRLVGILHGDAGLLLALSVINDTTCRCFVTPSVPHQGRYQAVCRA